jgi:hypothetical protein
MVVVARDGRLADEAGGVVRIARLGVCGDRLDRGDAARGSNDEAPQAFESKPQDGQVGTGGGQTDHHP